MVEDVAAAIGRDDLGVRVSDGGGGMLEILFSRGSRRHIAHVRAWELEDREHARLVVKTALLAFSKRIAQEALARAAV